MKTQVGHYQIIAELGRGGMGVVYKGYEAALGRYVAIKELSPALSHDANLVERFLREARSMAALNDPHIIQIYFIGQENDQPFFVMEFVEGESLSSAIKREGRLIPADALKILQQAAQGLAVAHDKGVIHRDIKPANLMLSPRGQVKLADFGIARANHDISSKLTSTGEFVGTPGYLSPEVCLGKQVDARSDIFALGIVLFEMLTGQLPFNDESPLKLMLSVVESEIPDIRGINAEVDPDTASILTRMVAKNPEDRFQDCHALIEALAAHPLVKAGGPLKMKTAAASGAAATMIGMPTPVTPGPMRAHTPPPVVSSSGISVAGAAAPAATIPSGQQALPPQPPAAPARPSALDRPGTPSSKGWLVGVGLAAALVVGLGWAFRGKFMGDEAPVAETLAGDTAAAGDENADTNASLDADSKGASSKPGAGDSADGTTAAVEPAATEDLPRPGPPMSAPPPPATPAVASNDSPPAAVEDLDARVADTAAPDRPAGAVRERIAERVAERALPAQRTYAVDAAGDPALVIPAQQVMEERLMNAGLAVVENPRNADVVIRIRAEVIGQQELAFYGQTATVTSAYLSVRPFAHGTRALGPGVRQRIEYTPINAEAKVQQVLGNQLDRVVSNARDGQ